MQTAQVIRINSITHVDTFSKMLIAVSSIGVFITQENGHRYINVDVRELSHSYPEALQHEDFNGVDPENFDDSVDPVFTLKHYGSFLSCALRVESWLSKTLLEIYDNLNYADTIIGKGDVE